MAAPEDVLWIGGSSGTGKSTLARLLARRYGLRWYSSDTRTWVHRDRAIANGDLAAIEWEQLTPKQRSELPPADKVRLEFDRSAMTLEDVAGLPDCPAVVAEGTVVTPAMVAGHGLAIWLTAQPTVRASRARERGWGAAGGEADRIKERSLLRELDPASACIVDTGDHIGPLETLEHVEAIMAGWLASRPAARSDHERRRLIRSGNAAIVAQYRGGMARSGNTAGDGLLTRAYDCECGKSGCTALVNRSLGSLPDPFTEDDGPSILALGHRP